MRPSVNFHGRIIEMYCRMALLSVLLLVSSMSLTGCSRDEPQNRAVTQPPSPSSIREPARDGAELFKQYCANCHPDGGNVSDPKRTLHGSVLQRNQINTPEDIVRIMRNPRSRMIRFDQSTLSDRDALSIAEYILATFK
jgi:cytochrome c6